MSGRDATLITIVGGMFLSFCVVGGCYGYPQYRVYDQRLSGEAKLKEAESSRMIQIEDAKGKLEAAKLLAQAEVERAKGIADANKVIGDSLKSNPEYLTYFWIDKVNASDVFYIATEAGIPILEAGRSIIKDRRERAPDPVKK